MTRIILYNGFCLEEAIRLITLEYEKIILSRKNRTPAKYIIRIIDPKGRFPDDEIFSTGIVGTLIAAGSEIAFPITIIHDIPCSETKPPSEDRIGN